MRLAVLHVLSPTTDIDISIVTVGGEQSNLLFLDPSVAGLLGDLYSSFNSFNAFNSFISFNLTTIGGLDRRF